MPFLVPDLYNYLNILKSVHSGTDLKSNLDSARCFLNDDLNRDVSLILENVNHWDKIEQMARVIRLRMTINNSFDRHNQNQFRELLYADMALEVYVRQLAESIFHINLNTKHLFRLLNLLLDNSLLNCDHQEFQVSSED